MSAAGRFAPSPSGDLHVGNLRTAALAWLAARATHRRFLVRVEDLDAQRSRADVAARQLDDLRAIGLTWDAEPVLQSSRHAAYAAALAVLRDGGDTYECYCTRREIREAQSAPHAGAGRYPGTCRTLSAADGAALRAAGRRPALRLRGADVGHRWDDLVLGPCRGVVDDVVLARADGSVSYNLAVVVDDLWQGVDQIVRGDDLAEQTATQLHLAGLLGGGTAADAVEYGHVPLVVSTAGSRLAKRDGAVTLADLAAAGVPVADVVRRILASCGRAVPEGARTLDAAVAGFDVSALPRAPWVFVPPVGC
ncbi:tRNA glutamyl-Q(34) synthetase GluQRS [Cumulibacter manganitolerans]|uniref:tRNA glutamyl-Q(34) synthetase GluQRS n=1 Tax=Cumulibacter manganitolerans TaxID=1884992 RepID=UPI001295AFC7|nr:tRNA glutamyl-Q(34) synthetase GluQRS [Cumulibacter manganitolerans]